MFLHDTRLDFAVDGALLAKLEEMINSKDNENADDSDGNRQMPMRRIDTYTRETIQDTPFLEPSEHDRGHQRQLSLGDSLKNTNVSWQRTITSNATKYLSYPKTFNWSENLHKQHYKNDAKYYRQSDTESKAATARKAHNAIIFEKNGIIVITGHFNDSIAIVVDHDYYKCPIAAPTKQLRS